MPGVMPSPARVVLSKMSWLLAKRVPEVYPPGTQSVNWGGAPKSRNDTGGPLMVFARVLPPDPKLVRPEIGPEVPL